jgi:dTDP-4-amino-4,6-dideoxygalactose transaminase
MVQLFTPSFRIEECLAGIRECLEKGWTGLGYKTVEMEAAWSAYTGLPYAHFLASNTVGLHLAFNILKAQHGWQDGDEIITSPLTFVSSNHAILYENLQPVFADVDDSLCICPQSLLQRITPRTRAVLFIGIGGNVGQYEQVRAICRERGLALILDAAHMAGTRVKGQHVGHDADVTVFSFQAVKNLPTADAGMICFATAELDAQARKLSWLGINKDTFARSNSQGAYKWMYDVEDVGYKYHGNSIMAAIGLVQLRYLDADNAYRRQIATWYDQLIKPEIPRIPVTPGCESSRHLFQLRVANRNELMLALNDHGVYPGVHYRDNTEYRMYAYAQGTCPNSHTYSQQIISLPLHMQLSYADVQHVVTMVNQYAQPASVSSTVSSLAQTPPCGVVG